MVQSSVGLDVPAAILAGGLARRLGGADKTALVVGRARIIDRRLAALSPVADDIRIVANDRARYAGLQIPVIADAIAGAGALGGLYSALLDARHDRVLILACDLPFITAALLQLRAAESGRELGPDAPAPYDKGSLFENVNTPHDHARARGWVELNEKPSEDRITE
jgi:molybdopterin-guanine dinucleotide biosynthesis protein A